MRIASGPWDERAIEEFLVRTAIPVRLATNGSSGPLVQSLWFISRGQDLWCCTQRTSVLTRRLERDNRVGFEVAGDEPPYRGVRGTGIAQLVEEGVEETLRALIDRYQGPQRTSLSEWLLGRIDNEIAIRIQPRTMSSWDYTPRMTE